MAAEEVGCWCGELVRESQLIVNRKFRPGIASCTIVSRKFLFRKSQVPELLLPYSLTALLPQCLIALLPQIHYPKQLNPCPDCANKGRANNNIIKGTFYIYYLIQVIFKIQYLTN